MFLSKHYFKAIKAVKFLPTICYTLFEFERVHVFSVHLVERGLHSKGVFTVFKRVIY